MSLIRKLRKGNGAQKMVNWFKDDLEDIEEPEEPIDVGTAGSITPSQYRKQVSRVVGQSVVASYRSGKQEGLRQADNDDRHFKLTMIGALASFLNMGLLLYVMKTMGMF